MAHAPSPQQQAARPSFSVLVCPDSYLWTQELTRLLTRYPPTQGAWQKKVFWGDEEPNQAFWNLFTQTGFFATSYALVVHQAEAWAAKHWANIDIMIFRLVPSVWPIFCLECAWSGGKPKIPAAIAKSKCLQIAEKKGWLWKHEGLTEKNLRSYVAERAKHYPKLPKTVIDQLAVTTLPFARSVEQELNKLSLYYQCHTTLNANDWQLSHDQDCNYFSCIHALKAGKLKDVLLTLANDRDTEKIFFILLAMLDREYRTLWELKTGQSQIQGPSRNYKVQEARAVTLPTLAAAMRVLVDAEWSVKQGVATVAQALDNLLVQTTRLFSPT